MGSSSSRQAMSSRDNNKPSGSKEETGVNNNDVSRCVDTFAAAAQDPKMLREATPELQRHLTGKQVIVPDLKMFQMVDLHARNDNGNSQTPREMALTCDRLVTYLMSSCTNSLNTVRIFYAWISLNIRWDKSKTCQLLMPSGFDTETVLRTRSTSPVGMNLLFYHFCRLVCIPCSLIHGVIKLSCHKAIYETKMEPNPNHAWVLILIQGQWRFIDCACASGYGDEVKDEDLTREFFFLPDPKDLINSHFPLGLTNDVRSDGHPETIELKEKLQMLREPITFEQFCRHATITVLGMCIGLELVSHSHHDVNFEKEAEQFSFRSDDVTDLACVLTDRADGSDCPHSVLCTRTTASEFRTVVKPPRPGSYGLSIFVKLESLSRWPESFHRVLEYSLRIDNAESDFIPFPEHFGVWGANMRAVHFGFSRRIFKFDVMLCRTGDLYVKLPVSTFSRVKAVVSSATSDVLDFKESKGRQRALSTLTMQTDGVVHVRARFSDVGFYAVSLLSQNREVIEDAGTAYVKIADFVVNCRLHSRCFSPLPKSFPMSQHFRCLLEEPLCRNLVANRSYNFRLISPFLKIVKVDGENMKVVPSRTRKKSRTGKSDENDDDDDNDDNEDGDSIDGSDNDRGIAWFLSFTPTDVGSSVYVYGCSGHVDNNGIERRSTTLSALFLFDVIADDNARYSASGQTLVW